MSPLSGAKLPDGWHAEMPETQLAGIPLGNLQAIYSGKPEQVAFF